MKQIINIGTDVWNTIFNNRESLAKNSSWSVKDLSKIYFSGDISALLQDGRLKITIIGTRDINPETKYVIQDIIKGLRDSTRRTESSKPQLPVIISGLAYGVDTCAHNYALDFGLPTVAVMSTGLDKIYPYQNTGLARRLETTEGCGILTQFPEQTAPLAINFLDRIKTMVLMSDVVIIPATKERGSSIVAARLAYEYDIPVFAVPGRLSDRWSKGCNELIRNGLAQILTDVEDVY